MKHRIWHQINHLDSLLHRYYRQGHGSGNPHRGQGRILSILKLQQEMPQKELGFLLDMRKQSLGELLTKLEHKGYIVREPSPTDGRAMIVKLTDTGMQAADDLSENSRDQKDFMNVLEQDEQEQLTGYLERLINALETEIDLSSEEHHDSHRHPHGRYHERKGNQYVY